MESQTAVKPETQLEGMVKNYLAAQVKATTPRFARFLKDCEAGEAVYNIPPLDGAKETLGASERGYLESIGLVTETRQESPIVLIYLLTDKGQKILADYEKKHGRVETTEQANLRAIVECSYY